MDGKYETIIKDKYIIPIGYKSRIEETKTKTKRKVKEIVK